MKKIIVSVLLIAVLLLSVLFSACDAFGLPAPSKDEDDIVPVNTSYIEAYAMLLANGYITFALIKDESEGFDETDFSKIGVTADDVLAEVVAMYNSDLHVADLNIVYLTTEEKAKIAWDYIIENNPDFLSDSKYSGDYIRGYYKNIIYAATKEAADATKKFTPAYIEDNMVQAIANLEDNGFIIETFTAQDISEAYEDEAEFWLGAPELFGCELSDITDFYMEKYEKLLVWYFKTESIAQKALEGLVMSEFAAGFTSKGYMINIKGKAVFMAYRCMIDATHSNEA